MHVYLLEDWASGIDGRHKAGRARMRGKPAMQGEFEDWCEEFQATGTADAERAMRL
ncbi:hypothetical protein CRPA23_23610 [Pseudomonas aeruginosa]